MRATGRSKILSATGEDCFSLDTENLLRKDRLNSPSLQAGFLYRGMFGRYMSSLNYMVISTMIEDSWAGELFPDFSQTPSKCQDTSSKREYDAKKKRILNLQWHNGFATEGLEGFPLLKPFTGNLPEEFISFEERNKRVYSYGIHGFLYDYKLESAWRAPMQVVPCLQRYSCVIAPDFSVFVDQSRALNVWNIYRNRWVSSFWQSKGIMTVPSASWGNVDSFDYCFDGLPENSIIAIGHMTTGKDRAYKKLYRLGVEALIERKHPVKLLVYGAPLDFIPDVDIVYYESMTQKVKNYETD